MTECLSLELQRARERVFIQRDFNWRNHSKEEEEALKSGNNKELYELYIKRLKDFKFIIKDDESRRRAEKTIKHLIKIKNEL